jgi:hypothetical protein
MAYESFTLEDVKHDLGLTLRETVGVFADLPPVAPSAWLQETLRDGAPLALAQATEKARSEWIIAPILLEVRRHHHDQISLFSGATFNVDAARGLVGFCDWIIGRSPELLTIEAPVVAIVEAKKEDFLRGTPQCLSEMYAAQIFNQRAGRASTVTHGAVTTGNVWRFLRLTGTVAEIDMAEYHMVQLDRVLGVLVAMTAG